MEPVPHSDEIRSMSFSPTLEENAEQGELAAETNFNVVRRACFSIGLVFLAIGLAIPAYDVGPFADLAGMLIVFGLLLVALGVSMGRFIRVTSKPFYSSTENRNGTTARTVWASEDEIVVEYVTGMVLRFPWPTIIKVRRRRLANYLMVSRQFFMVVPDRAFPEDKIAREFVSLCRRKIADNNFEKLDKRDRAVLTGSAEGN
ncbi:MAG TPA: YcxB family protein [Fimbriimonadaceae bacterium]|nr:YcxB family protein [Fimbriimonadaceae bacterium]